MEMKNKNVFPVIMDVTDKGEVKAAVDKGVRKFGRIDVLINNAGFGASGAFEEISDEELRDLMETNYFGVTNVMRAVIPIMRIICNLKAGYPGLTKWQNTTKKRTQVTCYAETWLGRRKYLVGMLSQDWGKHSFAERCALNTGLTHKSHFSAT